MRPVVWEDRRAVVAALALLGWLMSVEIGTSRRASRSATTPIRAELGASDTVVDIATGRLFDAAATVALVGGVAASLALPDASIRQRRLTYFTGMSVVAASGALSVVARRHLGGFHRNSLTKHADHELVDTGPYRRIRHPLYTATIGVFVGIGAIAGNWMGLALATLPALTLVHRIRVEERMLVDVLGPTYVEYRQRSDRLIPGVW